MLRLMILATLALTTPAPITVEFTSDSVYTYESILSVKDVQEQEDGLYTIIFEQDKLLGYCIYDNENTDYIDGLKFDDSFVNNYIVTDVDLEVEHHLLVKTVYTEDVAGMLAAAKDGDWSRLLSNPLVLLQIFYYFLAAIAVIAGGFGLFKSKAKKVKDHNQIADAVDSRAADASDALTNLAQNLLVSLVTPTFNKLQEQNDSIIKALMLSQSNDTQSKLALVELLRNSSLGDNSVLADSIAKAIEDSSAAKIKARKEANKIIKQIAEKVEEKVEEKIEEPIQEEPKEDDLGGISI